MNNKTTDQLPFINSSTTRRSFLKRSGLITTGAGLTMGIGGLWLPQGFAADMTRSPVAETQTGKVQGYINNGVNVYKGIPYGASTSGPNRFRPPQPASPWTGVRDTLEYGATAPQSVDANGKLGAGQSEDCLVLNVWTPAVKDGKKRPVMFWCHGGGFTSLSGSSESYDGTNLCNRGDVVVVTMNHRLNVMGFTNMAALDKEDFNHSGTAGMLDIVAALTWVKNNIEEFGGDPNTVMIYGESGGGRKVGTLLAMPAAKGLFHRAVIQSGPSIELVSSENGEQLAKKLLVELGVKPGDVKAAQQVPPEKVIAAYQKLTRQPGYNAMTNGFAPVVDGDSLPYHSFHPTASPVNPNVPVIVGSNRTELTLQMRGDEAAFNLDDAGLAKRVQSIAGDRAKEVLDVYRESEPNASPSELFFLIASEARYVVPCSVIAERRAALNGAPAYSYYLTWKTKTLDGKLMTPHALDIPFIFDNTDKEHTTFGYTTGTAEERSLADKVSDTWIAFARTGNPNANKLPEWKPYSAATRNTMVINNESKLVVDPIKERREVMQSVLGLA